MLTVSFQADFLMQVGAMSSLITLLIEFCLAPPASHFSEIPPNIAMFDVLICLTSVINDLKTSRRESQWPCGLDTV